MQKDTENMQNRTSLPTRTIFCPVKLPVDFPILCMRTDHWYTENQGASMFHFHNCLQIGYCYEGSGYSIVEGSLIPFCSGCVTVIPARIQHLVVSQPNSVSRWIWLYLDPFTVVPQLHPTHARDLMRIFFGEKALPFILHQEDQDEMIAIMRVIISELENQNEDHQHIVRLQTHAFLLLLLRAASQLRQEPSAPLQTHMPIIAPAVQHIAFHYMDNITVTEMAQLCHISTTHLRRVFNRVMKCTPLEYLQTVRLEAACLLLFRSDLSVLEIGTRVGFSTSTSFTRQFKNLMQITPGQWRHQSRSLVK